MFEQVYRADMMLQAAALNVLFLVIGTGVFLGAFTSARQRGLLLQVGE